MKIFIVSLKPSFVFYNKRRQKINFSIKAFLWSHLHEIQNLFEKAFSVAQSKTKPKLKLKQKLKEKKNHLQTSQKLTQTSTGGVFKIISSIKKKYFSKPQFKCTEYNRKNKQLHLVNLLIIMPFFLSLCLFPFFRSIFVCLLFCICIFLPVCMYFCLSICQSSVFLSLCLILSNSILCQFLSVCRSVFLSAWFYVFLSFRLADFLSFFL